MAQEEIVVDFEPANSLQSGVARIFAINPSSIGLKKLSELPLKVTPDYLESQIVRKSFTMEDNGKTMICRLTMANGTVFYGYSHCVLSSEFKEDLGREYSYKEAFNQAWDREGYLLATLRWMAGLNDAQTA